jgi:hypothetical protein
MFLTWFLVPIALGIAFVVIGALMGLLDGLMRQAASNAGPIVYLTAATSMLAVSLRLAVGLVPPLPWLPRRAQVRQQVVGVRWMGD